MRAVRYYCKRWVRKHMSALVEFYEYPSESAQEDAPENNTYQSRIRENKAQHQQDTNAHLCATDSCTLRR